MANKQETIMAVMKQELPQLKAIIGLNTDGKNDIETLALQELQYLEMLGVTNPVIYECMPQTVVMAIKNVLKQNLTLDPYAGLVYVKTRNVNLGTQQNPNWAKALEIQPSANGLISIARQCARIYDIKNPVVTKDAHGKVIGVKVEILVPSYDSPRWETREFDESDFERWRRASDKENGRGKNDGGAPNYKYANPNYTSWKGGIDPEFARAKAIRHGLKKLGTNPHESRAKQIVVPQEKKVVIDANADEAAMNDDYINHEDVTPENTGTVMHVETHEEVLIPDDL